MWEDLDERNQRVAERQNERARGGPAMPENLGRNVAIVVVLILVSSLLRNAIEAAWGETAGTIYTLTLLGTYLVGLGIYLVIRRRRA